MSNKMTAHQAKILRERARDCFLRMMPGLPRATLTKTMIALAASEFGIEGEEPEVLEKIIHYSITRVKVPERFVSTRPYIPDLAMRIAAERVAHMPVPITIAPKGRTWTTTT